jgi:hypothetical protein
VTFTTTPDAALEIDGTFTIVASVLPENADNKTLEWKSGAESIATVDATGKVTAVAAGKATITATAKDGSGKSASFEVTVNPAPEVNISGSGVAEALEIKASEAIGETPVPVVVNVAAPRGIENFKVQITSSSDVFMGTLTTMNLAGEFDLANPGPLGEVFTTVGLINGADVKDKTEVAFNITAFVPMIFQVRMGAAETGDCTADFKLTVTDKTGLSKEATVKLELVDDTTPGEEEEEGGDE